MQRLLILLLLASLGGGCTCPCPTPPATFSSVSLGSIHSNQVASAVPVGRNLLLTVSHATSAETEGSIVVDGWPTRYQLVAGGGVPALDGKAEETLPVYVQDWAILSLEGVFTKTPPGIGEPPVPGDTVWLQGFPAGKRQTLQGTVRSGFGTTIIPDELYMVEGRDRGVVLEGASGGAVLNCHGELVGIMIGYADAEYSDAPFWIVRKVDNLLQ